MNIQRTIEMPHYIGDERLDTILEILTLLKKGVNLELSFRKTTEISAAGHAILFSIVDIAAENKVVLSFSNISETLNFNSAILDACKNKLPLINLIDIKKLQVGGTDFFVYGKSSSIAPEFIEQIENKFRHRVHEDRLWDITLVLNELMQNIVDHSTAERYFIYVGINEMRVEFGALDMGVTIPAKLEGKYFKNSDEEFLELALVREVGTRRNRKGGMGLFYLLENIRNLKGRLVILSRKGQIRKNFGSRHHLAGPLKYKLSGTWCMASFPLEKL